MKGPSIYRLININFENNPVLPYTFQDPYSAGQLDVCYVLMEKQIPYFLKEKLTYRLIENIFNCLESHGNDSETNKKLKDTLEENALFLYFDRLINKLKLLLSEGSIDKKLLYSFGIRLATESNHLEEVKLGIILLGFFENDIVKKVIETLGLHSSFTLYALKAARNFKQYNKIAYFLSRNTCGYGKLISLYYLEPISNEQKVWMFQQGPFNEVSPNISSFICIHKPSMETFFKELQLDKDNFSQVSYILAYLFENSKINDFEIGYLLLENYLECTIQYARSFVDLAALVIIERGTERSDYKIRDLCNLIISQKRWKAEVLKELNNPSLKTSLVVAVLERLDLTPDFEVMINLFREDLFDIDLMRLFLVKHPSRYLNRIYNYLDFVVPDAVFENPRETYTKEMYYKYKPDLWLIYLLKAMRKERRNFENFYLKCLNARLPEVRLEAINALRSIKNSWSLQVLPKLEEALENEPVKSIQSRLLLLMDRSSGNNFDKVQRYIDVSQWEVKPSPFDIDILNTTIAGTFFHDLSIVYDQVKKGDILYLVRSPENSKNNKQAIMVTSQNGYVLGYIPMVDNSIYDLLDKGEKLYAILLSDNLLKGIPDIKVMLQKKPLQKGRVIKLN